MVQHSRLEQTQAQQQIQTLSPQQILAVKLLELPTVELEERIHAELLDNPALEEGKESSAEAEEQDSYLDGEAERDSDSSEDLSLGDYRTEDDIPDYSVFQGTTVPREKQQKKFLSPTVSPFMKL